MDSKEIYASVSEQYSMAVKGARRGNENAIANAFGYSEAELSSIPDGANLGLSCGNPIATATLREVSTFLRCPWSIRRG